MAPGRMVAVLALALLGAGAAGAATVYRWVDEQGRVHFSDRPPPGHRGAAQVELRGTPPPGGAETGGRGPDDRTERRRRLLRALEAERREREQARAAGEARRRQREARCRHARRRLVLYERVGVVHETDAEGRRRLLTEEERAARMAALRGEIARWCD